MNILYIVLGIAVLAGIYIMAVYNSLQQLKTQIQASIQEIGNQLKRQASLIPNLESAVKGHLKHEKAIFQELTDARKQTQIAEKSGKLTDIDAAINKLQSVIPQISVQVEDNPELKSNETISKFMNELTDTADKLMYARRSVIDLSQVYNVKLVTFPSNLVANMFSFKPEKGLETPTSGEHLTVSKEDMKDVKVNI